MRKVLLPPGNMISECNLRVTLLKKEAWKAYHLQGSDNRKEFVCSKARLSHVVLLEDTKGQWEACTQFRESCCTGVMQRLTV